MIDGHDRSFLSVADLVDYFRRNKSRLAARLRRPLKDARQPITPGRQYDVKYELKRKSLSLTGRIIGRYLLLFFLHVYFVARINIYKRQK